MRIRRKLLGAAAALAAAVPLGITAMQSPAQAVGPALLPVTFTNNTGRGDAVYIYINGVNLTSGRLGYLNASGGYTAWPVGNIPPVPAPDTAIAGPGNGGSKTLYIPRNFSGRVWFSFGDKINFLLTLDGLVQPAPWAPQDSNKNVMFDTSEFTYNDAGLWLNSSQVDFFAIPHTVTSTGVNGVNSTGTPVANGRNNVISQIRAAGWGASVQTRSDGAVLRVLSPGKAIDAGLMQGTVLDSYINWAWSRYTSRTLTVTPFAAQPTLKYYGRVSGNTMNFTNSSGGVVASFNKPSSYSVVGCAGDLPAPNDLVVGPISRTVCAALNRGTLGTVDNQPDLNAADFYKNSPTNQYSKIIHANMVDGKAYAFPFDDVGQFESLVHDDSPSSAAITLINFNGGGGTPPTTAPPTTAAPPPTTAGPPPTSQPPSGNAWVAYHAYAVGDIVTYGGHTYRVIQAHTSLPGWEPSNVPALFQLIS